MQKIKDTILLGIVAGLTGNALKNLGEHACNKMGMTQAAYPTIAGEAFMTKKQTKSNLGKTVGWLTDAALGAGLGVGYAYVLKFTGKDHALMKGVGYGHGAWTLFLGGSNKLMVNPVLPIDPKTMLSFYFSHTLYGIGLALGACAFGDKDLFSNEDIEKISN